MIEVTCEERRPERRGKCREQRMPDVHVTTSPNLPKPPDKNRTPDRGNSSMVDRSPPDSAGEINRREEHEDVTIISIRTL
jgi:hypothetical protein